MKAEFARWSDIPIHLLFLATAFLLALPIGWDRERTARSAGLRTFPMVAVATCGLVIVARQVLGDESQQHSRVLEGVLTGVGFLGAGTIFKEGITVRGTATAASIWTTAIVGAAVGYGLFDVALVLSVINFLVLRVLVRLKPPADGAQDGGPEIPD
ncbi:MAG: MgtC/SapB family protein [Rhodospirillales bacterium]|nr:MgtC/SapB family protein [Rhodospirillales bacterium]